VTLRCDGDDVVFCDALGHEERDHCGAQGLTCVPNTDGPGPAFGCGAKATTALPAPCPLRGVRRRTLHSVR
jgi:hypothetical protein